MSNTTLQHIPTLTHPAMTELTLALRRYGALASMPKHWQYPLIGDYCAVQRACDKAYQSGSTDRAVMLSKWLEREENRMALVAAWRGEPRQANRLMMADLRDLLRMSKPNWRRRTTRAWIALAWRLEAAIDDAVAACQLSRDSRIFAVDRLRDAWRHVEESARLDTEEQHN